MAIDSLSSNFGAALLGILVGVVRSRAAVQKQSQTKHKSKSSSVEPKGLKLPDDIISFRPIGVCHSIFQEKWGTPRQGSLCPATLGHIQMYKSVSPLSLDGLSEYSHVWIVFIFSENTNASKEDAFLNAKNAFTFPAKIKPPLLMGKRTGVFSTRSPHRPNNIGLTLCSIESINLKTNSLTVGGVDLIDGTPILDIKPFVPSDQVEDQSSLYFAPWLKQPPSQQPRVKFAEVAKEKLRELIKDKVPKFYHTEEAALVAIQQVLRLDVRGVGQGRGKKDTKRKIQKVIVDNMAVMFTVYSGKKDYERATGETVQSPRPEMLLGNQTAVTGSEATPASQTDAKSASSEAALASQAEPKNTSSEAAPASQAEPKNTSSEAAPASQAEPKNTSSEAAPASQTEAQSTSSEAATEAELEHPKATMPVAHAVTGASIEAAQLRTMEGDALYIVVTDIDGDLTKCWVDFETGEMVSAKQP